MSSSRTVLVVNPQSQQGALGKKWPHLSSRLRRHLGGFEEKFTQEPGDATVLARSAVRSGADLVVAIGGDGTINEVVNGFFDEEGPISSRSSLGILPFGTGGDFRKTLQVPKDLDQAAEILAARKTQRIDVGLLEYVDDDGAASIRYFANIASFGISGLVDEYVNRSSKRLGGRLSFFLATARASLRYENQRIRLTFDGDESSSIETTAYNVAIANGRYFGGGMMIAPKAELDDGLFDVVCLGDLKMLDLLVHGGKFYQGTHLALKEVSTRRAKSVRAEALSGPLRLDVDGETPGCLPATFTLIPAVLSVVVP